MSLALAYAKAPEAPHTANHLGEVLLRRGDALEAEKLFREAIRAMPRRALYYWNLALALEASGQCQEAFSTWQTYLVLERDAADRSRVAEHLEATYSRGGRCAGVVNPEATVKAPTKASQE